MATQSFTVAAALSAITGRLLCDSFGEVHALSEWVMGHSIWTHEFADKNLCERIKAAVIVQHPMLGESDASSLNETNFSDWLTNEEMRLGVKCMTFAKGTGARTEHPLESISRMFPDKPTIVIKT